MQPISVTAPITQAWERMVRILFQPFDAKKWFVLGFCAFLATLGQGGGNSGNSFNQSQGNSSMPDFEGQVLPWIEDHIVLIVVIALAFLLVIVALMALTGWLQARGTFMFLDGIVRNRGAVKEPWRNYRQLGNSLFVVKFVLGMGMFLLFVGFAAAVLALMWPAITSDVGMAGMLGVILVATAVILIVAIVAGIIGFVINDLIVPTMYANDMTIGAAWGLVKSELLPGQIGTIFLYVLMKIVLGLGIALVAILAMVLTCCLAALPYIGSVILLPLTVFMWGYNLYFVRQFGERFDVFRHEDEAWGDDGFGGDEPDGTPGSEEPFRYDTL